MFEENNIDWEATKAIYTNSIVDEGVIEFNISLSDMVGIRRLLLPKKKKENSNTTTAKRKCNIFSLTANNGLRIDEEEEITNEAGTNHNGDDDYEGKDKEEEENNISSNFEYCILNLNFQSPLIRVTFEYKKVNYFDDDDVSLLAEEEEGEECCTEDLIITLESVQVDVVHFPPAFELLQISPRVETSRASSSKMVLSCSDHCNSIANSRHRRRNNKDDNSSSNNNNNNNNSNYVPDVTKRKQWEDWLQSQCDEKLNERISFSICEFIEHNALSFFNIVNKDERLGYSALLFHDKEQNEYEHYDQSSVAIWKQSNTYSTQYDLDYQLGKKRRREEKKFTKEYGGQDNLLEKNPSSETCIFVEVLHEYAIDAIQQEWKKLVQFDCPICFDRVTCHEGVELPCRHFLCMTCVQCYIKSKVSDLHLYRQSPFICPIVKCKQGMKIKSGSYPITEEEKKSIHDWKFNLKHPKAKMLAQCPRKSCKSSDMRRVSSDFSETMVFCNACGTAYCELCLQKYRNKECNNDHELHICDESIVLKLCRRYKAAKDEIKQKAEDKWHWLKEYADCREEDISAKLWVSEHASRCPNCRTAIERIEGCFHMHCTNCGTHYCYECGEELYAPYYGTHHCWEEVQVFHDFD